MPGLRPRIRPARHHIWKAGGHRSLRRRIAVTILVGPPIERRPGDTIDTYPDSPRDDADRWWLPHDRGGTAPDPQTAHALDVAAVARIGDVLE